MERCGVLCTWSNPGFCRWKLRDMIKIWILLLYWALICYLHNPKFFFLEIPQGPLGISIGNIQSAQKAFRVPQSSVFCHFQCFIEISQKIGICSESRIFWPIFKCHTILESYRQHGRRATLQVKIRGLNKELLAIQEKNLTFYPRNIWNFFSQINPYQTFPSEPQKFFWSTRPQKWVFWRKKLEIMPKSKFDQG